VARALWQQVAHELKRDGVSKVTVNASNYAVPAYEKLGFVRVGEMKVFEGIPFNPMVNELSR
jgi:predicted GNAT family N-acyltransferase